MSLFTALRPGTLLGLWRGAWTGFGVGAFVTVWMSEQSPGLFADFARAGVLLPLCGTLVFIATLPDVIAEIVKGVSRFNAAARPPTVLK